jgi:hypothetical protein
MPWMPYSVIELPDRWINSGTWSTSLVLAAPLHQCRLAM